MGFSSEQRTENFSNKCCMRQNKTNASGVCVIILLIGGKKLCETFDIHAGKMKTLLDIKSSKSLGTKTWPQ